MSNFNPMTGAAIFAYQVEQYAQESNVPAATDPGSTMGAMFEAETLLALQLQQEVIYLFQISRLASCTGADVDSFVNPFGCFRNGPNQASGDVLFSYPSSGSPQTILIGSQVQTEGGTIFQVVVPPSGDPAYPYYYPALNGYIASPTALILVQCVQSGLIGNVLANTITLQYGGFPPIPGSPSITNPEPFTNGIASETDSALKARFALYISGGGEGTPNSIMAAVSGYQAGLTYSYGDFYSYSPSGGLTPNVPGWFTIVVNLANQASGPPQALLTGIYNALLYAVRPAGIYFAVIGPTLAPVSGQGTVIVSPGYNPASVIASVNAAFSNFVNGIGLNPLGGTTTCSLMGTFVALAAVPGVQDVVGLQLNGTTADVTAGFGSQLVAGTAGFT